MSKNYASKKVLAVLGLVFILPPILIQLKGIMLDNEKMLVITSLVFCIASILCGVKSFNQPVIPLRIATIIIVIVACFIGLMNIFQLF